MLADLVILDIHDFDVILRMDWLCKYHANIDCHKKIVLFQPPSEPNFKFIRIQPNLKISIISAMKARRMLNKGCTGYLVSIMNASKEESTVDGIRVVCEYADVFPEDLPGLPPDREVKFAIDLLPGTAPISKAPYRMSPIELKELKIQFQELLDKGFIRPSFSL